MAEKVRKGRKNKNEINDDERWRLTDETDVG